MPKWTDSQKAVIDHRSKNLLVSAAAGSGKTAVMIEHIYSLVASKTTTIDKLLVVTFTNAAAASMKEKLINRFESAYQDDPDNVYLLEQRNLIDRADISTIHSFCIKTLRRYYFKTPLQPDFRIIDSTQDVLLSEAAISDVLEKSAKKYNDGLFPEYNDALIQFSSKKSDIGLADIIVELDKFTVYMPTPEIFKNTVLKNYEDISTYKSFILDYYKKIFNAAIKRIDLLVEEFGTSEISATCASYTEGLYKFFYKAANSETLEDLKINLTNNYPALDKSKSTPLKELFKAKIEAFKAIVKSISIPEFDDESFKKLIPALKALFIMQEDYRNTYDSLMLEHGGTNFNGVLRHTVSLLDANPDVLADIKSNIDHIYVDEYQDVNAMQEHIVNTLSNGHNLFFVGDIKQSIYGFQLARPDLFKDKMISYADSPENTRINLKNNFRSYPQILDGVNFIFNNVMNNLDISEIVYDADSALYPSPDPLSPQYNDCLYVNDEKEIANELLVIEGDCHDEAAAIAARIKELISTCQIADASTGLLRPLKYNDIALLGCKRSLALPFILEFERQGIPFNAQELDEPLSSSPISPLVSLLNLIIIRKSDLHLITVMLSCIGGFTPNEMAKIRALHRDIDTSFYDATVAYEKDDKIKEKITRLFATLDKLELLERSMSIQDFIRYASKETGFDYFLASQSQADGAKIEFEHLVSSASAYTSFADDGLRGFMDYRERFHSPKKDFALDENDNSVRFMTIHKSKGLEFPVVILVDSSNYADGGDNIYKFSESFGLGFDHYEIDSYGIKSKQKSIAKYAINLALKKSESAENMRLLYVALTRARNKLIISCSDTRNNLVSMLSFCDELTLRTYRSYAQLILPLLYLHQDGIALREYVDDGNMTVDSEKYIFTDSNWKIQIKGSHDYEESVSTSASSSEKEEEFNESDYLRKLESALTWTYQYSASTTARTKHNPSKSSSHSKILLRKPMFEDREYKGAQKGTVVHYFMEHYSFVSDKSASEQANDMLQKGILTQDEYNALPLNSIEAFIKSEFAQKMKNAELICKERSFCLITPINDSGDESLMQGIIDCYFFYDDAIYLLDYKTDVIHNNIDERIEHHRPQLLMYKQALESLYPGKKVYPYIHFFSTDQTIEIK